MYSLKMSVCRVPLSRRRSTPCALGGDEVHAEDRDGRPADRHRGGDRRRARCRRTAPPCRRPSRSPRRSGRPRRATRGSSESRPISVGMSKATDSPPPPAAEDHLVALVGLLGVAEAGELPDRPGPAAVAGRVQPAGERELPRPADPLEPGYRVRRAVDRLDLDAGQRVKSASRSAGRVVPLLPAPASGLDVVHRQILGRPTKSARASGTSPAATRRSGRRLLRKSPASDADGRSAANGSSRSASSSAPRPKSAPSGRRVAASTTSRPRSVISASAAAAVLAGVASRSTSPAASSRVIAVTRGRVHLQPLADLAQRQRARG